MVQTNGPNECIRCEKRGTYIIGMLHGYTMVITNQDWSIPTHFVTGRFFVFLYVSILFTIDYLLLGFVGYLQGIKTHIDRLCTCVSTQPWLENVKVLCEQNTYL